MTASIILYGIRNCDTVKKACAWLETHGVAYNFHDYRRDGIDEARLRLWVSELGWEKLLNRSGTTFRKLADAEKQDLNEAKAIVLMLEQPSMIRRPVAEIGDRLLVGFDAERYRSSLQ
jgi:arsenate reductase